MTAEEQRAALMELQRKIGDRQKQKAQRKQQAKELFSMGIYDAEDLLEDLEHPRKQAVLEKFNERQRQAAEAEAAAAAAAVGGAPNPTAPSGEAPPLEAVPQ